MNNLAIDESPNPLKILKNISCFKKIIKGFRISDLENSLDVIMYQPRLIHSCLTKGFTIDDADFFKLSCKVYYNIPLVSSAWFGSEKGYSLNQIGDDNNTSGFERNELLTYLRNIELPDKVTPINIEMRQTIEDIESTFTFKINSK